MCFLCSNPSNDSSATSSYDAAASDSTTTMKGPVRHGSGSSNLSLGNSNCMGLDSGVGGSSFSLDQQKLEAHSAQQHSHHQQPLAATLVSGEQKARSSTNLSSMEQLKERLARVELAGGGLDTRRSAGDDDDAYMQMTIAPPQSKPVASTDVRRSSSFAKSGTSSLRRSEPPTAASQKPAPVAVPVGSQSPSSIRSPISKLFASFGRGSSKQQQPVSPPVPTATSTLHKSPTPSLKSIPSGSGGGDSRSRTPSASSKISLTDFGSTRPQQKTPAIVTNSSSVEAEPEPPAQLEYASLDLQHPGNPSPTRKTPSPRPSSSCSIGGDAMAAKLASQAPAVVVNDGVVYAQIDAARTSAAADAKAIPSRQY